MPYSGTWWNELGSQLNLAGSGAQVSGTYVTAVGSASGTYLLAGRVDTAPLSGSGQAIGWVVAWNNAYGNSHSLTSWAGQYQRDAEGELIYTLWLLANETDPTSNWSATRVGQDTFRRTKPNAAAIEAALAVRAPSHPHPDRFDTSSGGSDEE